MTKRIVDLTAEELERLAAQAWRGAAEDALARGAPVVGSHQGRLFRRHPDGRIEDLGLVASLDDHSDNLTIRK